MELILDKVRHFLTSGFVVVYHYAALLWQKEASDKSDISCKRAKCVCLFH